MLISSSLLKYYKTPLIYVLVSGIIYYLFGYTVARTNALPLIGFYTLLFLLAYFLKTSGGFNFRFLVISAILLRLLFLFAIPNLSQDFYRFIWDGRMSFEGFNPYIFTPNVFIQNGEFPVHQAQELYNGMGSLSAKHYTNYPPLNQFCFFIAALFSGKSILGSVVVMRLIIILADIGIIYFGKKLLEGFKLPSSRIWWYALNPFIIIELTGNLHFEGVMLFFLIWALYLLQQNKWKWAAVVFACSISVKLIPLMFLPLFFWWFLQKNKNSTQKKWTFIYLKLKNLTLFYVIIIGVTILLFLPFISTEFIGNYSKTVGLWFTNFEFNASVYYLARAIGYKLTGYNQIGVIGKILPIITILIILGFSLLKKNYSTQILINTIVLVFSCYLFLSTTVHPWYLATIVLFCVFTEYRFPIIWSFVIILSYLSYLSIGNADKSENLWLITLEYSIVFTVFAWEVIFKKKSKFNVM